MDKCTWCGRPLTTGRLFSWLGELFCKQSCVNMKAVSIATRETEQVRGSDIGVNNG